MLMKSTYGAMHFTCLKLRKKIKCGDIYRNVENEWIDRNRENKTCVILIYFCRKYLFGFPVREIFHFEPCTYI